LDWSLNNNVDLVSIDSPLGIPIGRTSFFDDDPYRHYGIMRECERTLKRRGINVYPCLIPSMQKLTRRGMALAEQFRQKGIPVIESYPGAAQDIMMIPRKQAGHDNLISGIKEFGVNGDFFYHKISHDELDAITSSIVGLFFWAGMFEKLGNPFEEHLIIPDLNANYKTWLDKHIVGFSETQQHTDELRAYLAMKGFVLIAWDELLNNYKDNFELKMRSSNLSKEIDIDINFYKKWSGKELTEMSNDHDRVAFVGINTADDKALLIESFGPSFQMFASSYNFQKDFLSLIKDN
jgi:predicted nuclease with RNAse H fold